MTSEMVIPPPPARGVLQHCRINNHRPQITSGNHVPHYPTPTSIYFGQPSLTQTMRGFSLQTCPRCSVQNFVVYKVQFALCSACIVLFAVCRACCVFCVGGTICRLCGVQYAKCTLCSVQDTQSAVYRVHSVKCTIFAVRNVTFGEPICQDLDNDKDKEEIDDST